MKLAIELDAARLRQIHHGIFSTKEQLTSPKAEAFLLVHGEELTDELHKTIRDFLKQKLA